jgi:hypothetical protein
VAAFRSKSGEGQRAPVSGSAQTTSVTDEEAEGVFHRRAGRRTEEGGGPDGLLSGGRINGAALMPTSGAN